MTLIGAVIAGATAVFFAILMLFQRSLYASAVCLLVVLLQSSVLYFVSGSPLLAFLQIMIYAGAVMVLVVITIMASPEEAKNRWSSFTIRRPVAALGLSLPLGLAAAFLAQGAPVPVANAAAAAQAQQVLGAVLFGPYSLATEAVGLLLLLSGLVLIEARK
jgi:NADH-quinone oxidoreductase subunit J